MRHELQLFYLKFYIFPLVSIQGECKKTFMMNFLGSIILFVHWSHYMHLRSSYVFHSLKLTSFPVCTRRSHLSVEAILRQGLSREAAKCPIPLPN